MKFVVFLFSLFIINQHCFSQTPDSIINSNKIYYFTNKPFDVPLLIVSPFKWNKLDAVSVVSVAGLGTLAYLNDEKLTKQFLSKKNKTVDFATKNIFQPMGNGVVVYSSVLATLGIAQVTHNKKLLFLTHTASKSLIYTGIITQAIKYTAHRHRPYESPNNARVWDGISLKGDHHSFVSGHSSTAFSLATSIASEYHNKPIIKWTAYGLASCVAISRVYDNKHWSSDVIAGAALGYAVSRFCYNSDKYRLNNTTLVVFPTNTGLQLVYNF